MLQITPHHRLQLAVKPVDFRRGIDGLSALCRQSLEEDPFNGTIFIFTNRSRKAVKILVFDGNGFWLCAKRFSKGRLAWWPTLEDSTSTSTPTSNAAPAFTINPSQLSVLLAQGNPLHTSTPPNWRELPSSAGCFSITSACVTAV